MEAPTDLFDYLNRENDSYSWKITSSTKSSEDLPGNHLDILLTSQTWQGIVWKHHLTLYLPRDRENTDYCALVIGADYRVSETAECLQENFRRSSGIATACLYDVPNQPLFDGMVEDELIAHTLVQRLDTGDANWPLLFPMTRSAITAMDAVQEICAELDEEVPERFIVTGASKRGWTTWLCAVADPRVSGIIPVVYDNLNLFRQLPHQVEVWTGYSEQISDYTRANLPHRMATMEGVRLALSIDPFTYVSTLHMPKLIVNGANDRYWATDALNLYWDSLRGRSSVLYVPNYGHNAGASGRCADTCLAFLQTLVLGRSLPLVLFDSLDASRLSDGGAVNLYVRTDSEATAGTVWLAVSDSPDFRESEWRSIPLTSSSNYEFHGVLSPPSSRFLAVFAELTFPGIYSSAPSYTLSSTMLISESS